ncbi:mechanosensitive ion channel family protein [Methanocaldococcus indicus]|uniref:mechanosensitive ion channel family protein n=1 Tax=Methanocaldococcus indicus TaxID=213231 RepID=UPI003C6D4595
MDIDIYKIIVSIIIVVLGILGSLLINKIIKNYIRKLFKKTKTKLDDIILDSIDNVIVVGIVAFSIYLSLVYLNIYTDLVTNGFKAFVILLAGYAIYRLADKIFDYYIIPYTEKTDIQLDDHIVKPLKKLTKILIIIFSILTALSSIGYDITALLAGLGIGGLAVALAMQDVIKNFIAGVLILIDKPFLIGHWIKVGDFEGIVEEIGMRTTKIRTFDKSLVIMPNYKILDSEIENFDVRDRRRVLMTIGLVYSTPPEKIRKAKEIILKIIEEHEATLPPYRVHFVKYGDWSLNLRVEYFIRNIGFDYYLNALEDINLKIKEEFEKENIEMAFPTYSIYLEKDN